VITCQKCRALLAPGTKSCPYCGTDQRHHLAPTESEDAERTTRFGLWILGIIIGLFVLTLLLDPAKGDQTSRFRPSESALVMFGAVTQGHVRFCGQYWRMLVSMFLHVDLLHLAFNSVALLFLIPIAAHAFGVHRTACIYLASGLVGSAISTFVGNAGVGASGALCGLIAAGAVYGWRRGGALGQMLARRMVFWAVIILAYGFFLASAVDNAGHIGGFLGGQQLVIVQAHEGRLLIVSRSGQQEKATSKLLPHDLHRARRNP